MKKVIFLVSTIFFVSIIMIGCRSSLVVRDRPYPPSYERPIAPGPNHVWVTGEWVKRGRGYIYRPGYWSRQRGGHMYYISGHWQSRRQGWTWIRGYWR
ncbi:MAG: hypothetical protein ABI237_17415 [Ginsengibacter sp.]